MTVLYFAGTTFGRGLNDPSWLCNANCSQDSDRPILLIWSKLRIDSVKFIHSRSLVTTAIKRLTRYLWAIPVQGNFWTGENYETEVNFWCGFQYYLHFLIEINWKSAVKFITAWSFENGIQGGVRIFLRFHSQFFQSPKPAFGGAFYISKQN